MTRGHAPRGVAGEVDRGSARRDVTHRADDARAEVTPAATPTTRAVPDAPRRLVVGGAPVEREAFLDELRAAVEAAAAEDLGPAWSVDRCPYIDRYFGLYAERAPAELERTLARYAPEAAASPSVAEAIAEVVGRVRDGLARWRDTGTLAEELRAVAPPGAFADAAEAHLVEVGDPRALGHGHAPAAAVAAAAGFGGDAQVHDDALAARIAAAHGAAAVTLGTHVAFAAGAYRPHEPVGAALLAHELAHVGQQAGAAAGDRVGATSARAERDADAAGAEMFLGWLGLARQARSAQAASGLALQRCDGCGTAKEREVPPPVPAPAPMCVKPAVKVTATGPIAAWAGRPNVVPGDVAQELVCESFQLTTAFTDAAGVTVTAGTAVMPTAWDNTAATVPVVVTATGQTVTVPKLLLRPAFTPTAGVVPYASGIDATAKRYAKASTEVETWIAAESSYTKKHTYWAESLTKLQTEETAAQSAFNDDLIRQFMWNRFDADIAALVAAGNTERGLTGAAALDPDLIKAMLFKETAIGTTGPYLQDDGDVRNHYNIGQAVDSSGSMYMAFLLRDPARTSTFHLETMKTDLEDAMRRKKELDAQATRTPAEEAELTELTRKSARYWETFVWEYRAAGQSTGFNEAVADLWASQTPALNLSYQHWIQMQIFWLFEKRSRASSWQGAVKDYNGSKKYAKAIFGRLADVKAAGAAGKPYRP
ncbi:MAG: DUF4157 domain-containing protein [Kofleriaceae bacterium]